VSLCFLVFVALLGALVAFLSLSELGGEVFDEDEGKGKRLSGQIEADIVAAVSGPVLLDIDDRGTTHAVWGKGFNWDSPGSIWYAPGN